MYIVAKTIVIMISLFEGKVRLKKLFLVPPEDFYHYYQYRSTCNFINIIPLINTVPWEFISLMLREYAIKRHTTLDIYTGTLNHLRLPDAKGRQVPIYIDYTNKTYLPVPEIIWKAVYDRRNYAGIAFIGINNFYQNGNYSPLCRDISRTIPWMNKTIHDNIYACALNDWGQIVPNIIPRVTLTRVLFGTEMIIKRYQPVY